ncbi:centrosomal protein of 164 kDa [Esox lucius]|uniref:centrosomal protein of 164 kDa n=1 Tax=Esox lucius TaxID=8010 RepID=UPI0014776B04|nr:centrosomal protein of 164 kDa [Esox lucius]
MENQTGTAMASVTSQGPCLSSLTVSSAGPTRFPPVSCLSILPPLSQGVLPLAVPPLSPLNGSLCSIKGPVDTQEVPGPSPVFSGALPVPKTPPSPDPPQPPNTPRINGRAVGTPSPVEAVRHGGVEGGGLVIEELVEWRRPAEWSAGLKRQRKGRSDFGVSLEVLVEEDEEEVEGQATSPAGAVTMGTYEGSGEAKQKGKLSPAVHLPDARDSEQDLAPHLTPLCPGPAPPSPLAGRRVTGRTTTGAAGQDDAGSQQSLSSALGSLQAPLGPLGSLGPLRGLDGPAIRGSLGSSGGLEPLKSSLGGPLSSLGSSLLGGRQEERMSLSLPGFEDDVSEEDLPSRRGSARLLQNLHLDLDALGGGLQYEDSEASVAAPPEERTEPELQDLALSGEHSPDPPSQQIPASSPCHPSSFFLSVNASPSSSLRVTTILLLQTKDSLHGHHLHSSPPGSRGFCPPSPDPPSAKERDSQEEERDGEDYEEEWGEERVSVTEEQGGEEENRREASERWSGEDEDVEDEISEQVEWDDLEEGGKEVGSDEEEEWTRNDRKGVEKEGCDEVIEKEVLRRRCVKNEVEENDKLEFKDEKQEVKTEDYEREVENGKQEIEVVDDKKEVGNYRQVRESDVQVESGVKSIGIKKMKETGDEGAEATKRKKEQVKEIEVGEAAEDDENSNRVVGRSFKEEVEEEFDKGEREVLEICVKSEEEEALDNGDEEVEEEVEEGESEVVERCVKSEEEEVVESEASEHIEVASSSTDADVKEEERELKWNTVQEEEEEKERTESEERRLQAAGMEDPAVEERPPSRPGESQQDTVSSHSAHRPRAEGVSASLGVPGTLGVKRPDTSRGRLARSPHVHQGEESLRHKEDRRTEEEEEKERLRRETERAIEEHKERALRERQEKMRLLLEELRRQEEEEERRLKEESEEKVRSLRQMLQSRVVEEEGRLRAESDSRLHQLRETAQREREDQERTLREEGEVGLKKLRALLEAEREAELERLEAQRRQDLDRLRLESEEELQVERRRLLGEREEQLSSLKQEGRSSVSERWREMKSPRSSEQHLAEYQRELGEVLQEVREEVQREHAKKLEQLKDDHRRELNSIREKHLDQEAGQRERLMCSLQEERDRVLAAHSTQLENLRKHLETQLMMIRQTHTRREAEIQELGDKLELRARELESQEAHLKKRRKQLGDEEEELDRGIEALSRVMQERDRLREDLEQVKEERDRAKEEMERVREERNNAREEMERARKDRDKVKEESRRVKEERDRLESKVELLQERCDRLTRRVSDLEQKEMRKPPTRPDRAELREEEEGKKSKHEEAPSSGRERGLHVDDLEEPPVSPVPSSDSSLDDLRQYISSEGLSLQRARRFLERESGRLSERQAALQEAQAHSSSGPEPDAASHTQATQEIYRSLKQEASDVEELRLAVQRGNTLLRRKEERLQQLESSVAAELSPQPSYDELSRLMADRKVAFDVTESDVSSASNGHDSPGGHPTVPAKVQQLAESLQHISGQLNTVLGALTQRQTPYHPLPLPQPLSQPRTPTAMPLSGPSWAWVPHSTCSQPRGSEDLLNSRWAKLFPGAPAQPIAISSLRNNALYSGYTPASEQARSLSSLQPKSVELDGQRLQGLIDGNKRWLETRRRDPNVPLFTRYRTGKNGLVQLSLDDNNQIKVYHY